MQIKASYSLCSLTLEFFVAMVEELGLAVTFAVCMAYVALVTCA